ncbi:UDP-N-acetylmuramate dehydrogenase [Patescibacteria group bacterium]|nr:UDP-N-acetylmuramate dehydrogenase [Patescibacteria group bacterium]
MSYQVQSKVALAPYTTLKTGGDAEYFVTVENTEDLKKAVAFAKQAQLPFCVLGGGSNMLVPDAGYPGVVIQMKLAGVTYTTLDETTYTVTVAAGEVLDVLVEATVARQLWGLENLSHIPGSVGATPVQNVGAYGVEVADVISEVIVFDTNTNKIITLQNSDCQFSYRHSIFKEKNNLIILSVTFILHKNPNPKIAYADLAQRTPKNPFPRDVRTTVIAIRAEKFPDWTIVGTAGSFFKNPMVPHAHAQELALKYPALPMYPSSDGQTKISLGYVLDKICGLKGFAIGPVRLYEKQALVLVAEAGATTTDIKNFVKIISEKVFAHTAIKISQEVTEI